MKSFYNIIIIVKKEKYKEINTINLIATVSCFFTKKLSYRPTAFNYKSMR